MKPQNINMERTRNTKEAIINKIETMFEMESGIACPNTHFSQNGRIVKISFSLDNKQSK